MSSKPRMLAVLAVYLIAGFALFGPFLDNPFLMDDEIQVTRNVHIQTLSEWPQYFTSSTMDGGGSGKMGGIYFKPLMTVYFAAIWHAFGENAAAFRVPLLLMQIFSGFFIFLFLQRFFKWPFAFVAGLIFILHPVNSEIVAYIADAQDALYMFFGLLGLTLFMHLRSGWAATLTLGALLLSALLGKETGALFLIIVPTAALLFDESKFKNAVTASCAVAFIYAVLRIHSGLLSYEHHVLLVQQASYLQRLMTIPLILSHYLEIFFFPLRISLVTDFVIHSLSVAQFYLPVVVVLVFAIVLTILWKSLPQGVEKHVKAHSFRQCLRRFSEPQRVFLFSMSILLLWFLLHGSILLPLDGTYADRWFYLGTWSLLILVLLAAEVLLIEANRPQFLKVVITGVAAVFVIGFAIRTQLRLQDWAIPLRLYEREFAQRPFDAIMANNVGFEYFHRGEIRKAELFFEKATENNPLWDVPWNNLGAAAQRLDEADRALELYKKSTSLGTYYLAYENYASLLCARKVDDECRSTVRQSMTLFPLNATLRALSRTIGLPER